MKTKDWAIFWLLGLIWGTSFLWIKIAVVDVSPLVLVGFRTLIGSLGLGAIILANHKNMPTRESIRAKIPDFLVLGLINIALPWALISWGEQFIDSGIAAILNSAMPLFTIIIAPLMIKEERITLPRVIGLITGFLGVIILMMPSIQRGWSDHLLGMAASLLSTILYALSAVYGRIRGGGLLPRFQSFLQLTFGSVMIWLMAFITEGVPSMPTKPITWIALVWLGLLGSCLAYIFYFYLLYEIGPTRTSLVTYIPPLMGVLLGIFFLNETFHWQSILGALLILSGIFIVNYQKKKAQTESS